MKKTDVPEKRRMGYGEYNAVRVIGAMNCYWAYVQEQLQTRAKGIYKGWARIRLIQKLLELVETDILRTVPIEELRAYQLELKNLTFDIRMKRPINCDKPADNCVVMRESTAIALCKMATNSECMLCEKHGKDVRRCKVRKLLNESLMYEPPEADECLYQCMNPNLTEDELHKLMAGDRNE